MKYTCEETEQLKAQLELQQVTLKEAKSNNLSAEFIDVGNEIVSQLKSAISSHVNSCTTKNHTQDYN